MKRYLIYKTTNLINNKFYIGAHETINVNDGYLGSGILLNKAIKKYGIENFKKEILKEFNNSSEMYEEEKNIVEKFLGNPLCYNINSGGSGGWDYVNKNINNKNNPMKNPDIVKKCMDANKKTRNKNKEKYAKIANENLKKAIAKNIGNKKPKHSKFMSEFMKNKWETKKESLRDNLSSWFLVIDPDKNEFKTNRLQDFCLQKNIPYTTIWKSSKDNKIIKKGKAKGWLCKIIQN